MHFFTSSECETWLSQRRRPNVGGPDKKLSLPYYTDSSRLAYIAQWISQSVMFGERALLWVTDAEISHCNWHLYYRLRQSYGDHRQLEDAPGHLCQNYESEDLASLLLLTMLNQWDAILSPQLDYVSLFFSHHGFIDVYSEDEKLVEEIKNNIGGSKDTGA